MSKRRTSPQVDAGPEAPDRAGDAAIRSQAGPDLPPRRRLAQPSLPVAQAVAGLGQGSLGLLQETCDAAPTPALFQQ